MSDSELEARLRPAGPADVDQCARLILASDSGLLSALFSKRTSELLAFLCRADRNHFGLSHIRLVEDHRGIAGMVLAYPQARIGAEAARSALLLLRFFGLRFFVLLPRLSAAARLVASLSPGDWYVSNLAVFPAWRGRGLGRRLLAAIEAEALGAAGARSSVSVQLDVDPRNQGARSFYRALGYAEGEAQSVTIAGESFTLLRVSKELEVPSTMPSLSRPGS